MLCPFCAAYAGEDEIVCPKCGKLLPRRETHEEGVMAIRQGKRAREAALLGYVGNDQPDGKKTPVTYERQGTGRTWVDPAARASTAGQIPVYAAQDVYDAQGEPLKEDDVYGMDRVHRSLVYGETGTREIPHLDPRPSSRAERKRLKQHPINWAKMTLLIAALLLLMALGVLIFLRTTDTGQKILARLGRDAASSAYWEIGEEKMDIGDIVGAIEAFERAKGTDEAAAEESAEINVNVSGLLMLASCYEASGRTADAETIYVDLYTNVVPTAADAYTHEIRILIASGRLAEAAKLMQTAYQHTGQTTFRTQRNELLPKAPETTVYAGLYEEKKYVTLTSAEEYPIYYTFNPDAVLPEEGTLYTEQIFLDEGIWSMRAVAVNGQLVSDELSAVYRIIMPSPQTPRASLAPNTYKQRQRVRLWPGLDNMEDDDITIYYTIDGSLPDADSPIYTGEPIWLPGNYCDLHAVAVNRYGKASNTLSIRYKILAKPYPLSSYSTEDIGSDMHLTMTTWDDFRSKYGDADEMEIVNMGGIDGECQKRIYSWGYAIFYRQSGRQLLGELYFTTGQFKAPRGTGVGNSENDVVGKFRDMGQVESPSGNRGLYENDSGKGMVYVNKDGTKTIRYTAITADSHRWQLEYTLSKSGTVIAVDQLYIP
ncbi:MAG: chitobiase/beta-hexosaminidase C-terminal domain-containing protein [Clostridia bacterium]|nr:chitobiase/beta-hexosaminidase C-terminal domain-containing protein [Clostridia bacterium]